MAEYQQFHEVQCVLGRASTWGQWVSGNIHAIPTSPSLPEDHSPASQRKTLPTAGLPLTPLLETRS